MLRYATTLAAMGFSDDVNYITETSRLRSRIQDAIEGTEEY